MARGFPWRPGDNVVISDAEHENNTFPWRRLGDRGVEVRCVGPDEQGRTTVDCYAPAVDARTRIISVAWVTYGNGFRTPIRWEERAGIVSIDLDRHAGEVVAKLKDQGVIVSEKDGRLRASVHIYNNEEDIEQLLVSLQRC